MCWLTLAHAGHVVGSSVGLWGVCCKRSYRTSCIKKVLDCDWNWAAPQSSKWYAESRVGLPRSTSTCLFGSINTNRQKERNRIGPRKRLCHDADATGSQLKPPSKLRPPGKGAEPSYPSICQWLSADCPGEGGRTLDSRSLFRQGSFQRGLPAESCIASLWGNTSPSSERGSRCVGQHDTCNALPLLVLLHVVNTSCTSCAWLIVYNAHEITGV